MTKRFRGTNTVIATAFEVDGAIDLDTKAQSTDWQILESIHGLIPLGFTGGFLSMTTQERQDVAKCVIDTTGGGRR